MRSALVVILLALGAARGLASGETDAEVVRFRDVREVVVKAQFFDVDVTASGSRSVEMAVDPGAPSATRQQQIAGTLSIWVARGWPAAPAGGRALQLRVPQGIRMRIETISGDVRVQ